MQNSFDTSFIPQQPLLRVEGAQRPREPVNFALVLAFVLFFSLLITAVGMYFYGIQIDKRILKSSLQLEEIEKTLASEDIASYKRLDSRIATTKALLLDHGVFSLILNFLEQKTAKDVGLTALSYGVAGDRKIALTVSGIAPGFQSVYFQSETWKKATPFVSSMSMNKLNLEESTGVVAFEAIITLDPALFKYKKAVEAESAIRKDQEASSEISPVTADETTLTPSML